MRTVREAESSEAFMRGQASLKRIIELEALWRTSQRCAEAARRSGRVAASPQGFPLPPL